MGFFRGSEYLKLPRNPHTWLVRGVVPHGGRVNIFGKPKTGKSMAALQLASALGSGAPEWLGFPVLNPGPVAYLQVDTPREIWMDRVEHLLKAGCDFENVFFADGQEAPYPFDIMTNGYEWMKGELAQMPAPPVLVIWDTWRDIHSGEEDDSTTCRNVMMQIRACVGWGAAIMIVSHERKGGGSFAFQNGGTFTPDIRDVNRGSGAMAAAVDAMVWMQKKRLTAVGRAFEEVDIGIKQNPETWMIELADPFTQDALRILHDALPSISLRALATALQGKHPKKSLEACRSTLRRLSATTRSD